MKPWAKASLQGVMCGLMIGLVLLIDERVGKPQVVEAQAKPNAVAEIVRTRSIEVVDARGNPRIILGTGIDGTPVLSLNDARGNRRVILVANTDGSQGLSLNDADGNPRICLLATDGSLGLRFSDAKGEERVILAMAPDGEQGLSLYDADGNPLPKPKNLFPSIAATEPTQKKES